MHIGNRDISHNEVEQLQVQIIQEQQFMAGSNDQPLHYLCMADECMVIQPGECAPISVPALRSMHVWLRAIDCESEGIVLGGPFVHN